MSRASSARLLAGLLCTAALASCATTAPVRGGGTGSGTVVAVASINVWGSILAQLGGDRVHSIAIISNPNTDPHDYEPTPADARLIASAKLFVENGVGYDSWAAKAVKANPVAGRQVLDVGQLTGTPAGGNPHRWYSPTDVDTVADAITAALQRVDPADSGYFAERRKGFDSGPLGRYHQLISQLRARYAGTPVGASESIFAPLAAALGLDLITPPSFLKAVSEGTDPSAADKATIDNQVAGRQLKVYVYNSQNSTPDVSAQVTAARRAGIPVCAVTETLTPAGASFQDWQVSQLSALQSALAAATGR
ncbi:MAG TPA: zinc ABC transporter substrate-binding protein [Jatrophihabitans sp.]|nr:zinc ABC transporter substrate-binding protein [Jatrophihabitans sp.]